MNEFKFEELQEVIDEFKTKFFKYQSMLYCRVSILIILFDFFSITNIHQFKYGYLCILIYTLPSIIFLKYTIHTFK